MGVIQFGDRERERDKREREPRDRLGAEALCWACARRVGGAFSARAPPAAAARCSQSRQGAIIRRLAPALTTPPTRLRGSTPPFLVVGCKWSAPLPSRSAESVRDAPLPSRSLPRPPALDARALRAPHAQSTNPFVHAGSGRQVGRYLPTGRSFAFVVAAVCSLLRRSMPRRRVLRGGAAGTRRHISRPACPRAASLALSTTR